jgi:hypothetical protein
VEKFIFFQKNPKVALYLIGPVLKQCAKWYKFGSQMQIFFFMEESKDATSEEDRKKKRKTPKEQSSSRKPWWLVGVLALILILFGIYVHWLNSPRINEYESFWAYLLGPRISEVVPESRSAASQSAALGEIGTPIQDSFAGDSTADSWDTQSDPQLLAEADTSSRIGFEEPVAPATSFEAPATPSETPTYYVKAGEFKSKSSALFRIKELQQGNYSSRLIEPASSGGTYTVAVGEFKDYAKAREQSRAINFILEINSTVEKK